MHSIEALKFGDNSFLRQTTASTECSVRYINFSDKSVEVVGNDIKVIYSYFSCPKVQSHILLEMSIVTT